MSLDKATVRRIATLARIDEGIHHAALGENLHEACLEAVSRHLDVGRLTCHHGRGAHAGEFTGTGGIAAMSDRRVVVERKTNETDIRLTLDLDGTGQARVATGIGFLDHLLTALARHSRMDLDLACWR